MSYDNSNNYRMTYVLTLANATSTAAAATRGADG